MPLNTRRRALLIKAEVTYGVDSVPVVGTNAILVRDNLEFTPMESDLVSRNLVRGFMGGSERLVSGAFCRVTFEVEMAGSGTAGTAPAYDALLKACGLGATIVAVTSVTYKPISDAIPSVSIYFNVDGVRHRVTGARGNVEVNIKAGEIPFFKFVFTGLYNAPTDSAIGSPVYTPFISPLVANSDNTSGFSLFAFSGAMDSLNLSLGNTVGYRRLIGAEDVNITSRDVNGTIVIEAPSMTQKDYFTIGIGNSLGALAVLHGTTAGNRCQITSSSVSIANPSYQDMDGIHMLNLPVALVPTGTGDNEVNIIFT